MKTIILYIFTVGVMFAGLLLILEAGEKLKAPVDISGVWYAPPDIRNQLQTSCAPIKSGEPVFLIEQSGIYISVLLNDAAGTRLQGKLDENILSASGIITLNNKNCGSETQFDLRSKCSKNSNNEILISGTFSTPQCAECRSVSFTAQRKMENE